MARRLDFSPQFSFRRWSAWAPVMAEPDRWQTWAREEKPLVVHDEVAPVKAMPPLLRRRAQPLGRAALEVLYAPSLDYANQPIIFCSRYGETGRCLNFLQTLAEEGKVSPQEFSVSVHNATPGLFLIAKQCRAAVTALASETQLALSGIQEALAQIADGAPSVILVFCEEPLTPLYRAFVEDDEPVGFAFALEIAEGKDYQLVCDEVPTKASTETPFNPSALSLLRFALDETRAVLPLTGAEDWKLLRAAPEAGHA
ncbi:MAG: beta-ketoacyl synthase chain length factor [Burkholderiales bacterium]|jgi:hypothetical protein|nr:beta-ketoacyl synthase chain length factor [Burkholderiales bacterium]